MMTNIIDKLVAAYGEHRLETISRAWCVVDKWERMHRLRTVMALSVELDIICSKDKFSTAFGEMAIEAVIEGDWREVDQVADFLTFESEGPETVGRYGPLWEQFRTIAKTASAEARRRRTGDKSVSN
jgi:hypothetical protein